MAHSRRILLLVYLLPLALAGCESFSLPSWMGGEKKQGPKLEGERISVLRGAAELKGDPSLEGVAVEVPGAETNSAWPQKSGGVAGIGGNLTLPVTLENRQSSSIGDGADFRFRLVPSPVAGDGAIFAMDAEGRVSAHDMKDVSEVRWISPGAASEEDEPVMGGGIAYDAGKVFAVSGKGMAVALDAATGMELWRQPLNIPVRSAPRVADGRVYVVTVDSQLFALSVAGGEILWNHRGVNEGTGFLVEASPAIASDLVITPYASGEVHTLSTEDGDERWSDVVMGPQRQSANSVFTGIGGDPVVSGGMLYIAGSASMFAVFQPDTGRRLWEQPVSSINTPWVAGDYVYLLTSDSVLMAFNRIDGRVKWASQLPMYDDEDVKRGRFTWNGPVMAGGRLLIVGGHGVMIEASPQDGSVLSETDIPSGIYTPPVVADGVLYLVSEEATLYAMY